MTATALAGEAAAAEQADEQNDWPANARSKTPVDALKTAHIDDAVQIQLLNGFSLDQAGRNFELPFGVQRLVVFLSLRSSPVQRQHTAGALWPETTDQKAAANLRSALWRLNQIGCPVVQATGCSLKLASNVRVDLRERTHLAQQVLGVESHNVHVDPALFCCDLLPDWYDDWLVIERERFHQLRLRVLESLCQLLAVRGRYDLAVEAALAAVAAEPLRESAHRALVGLYLTEGNRAEAVRQFKLYSQLVHDELGFSPSPQFFELLEF